MATHENTSPTAERELFITRLIKAPRNLVWDAWTDPKHIVHWWGPDGFTNTIHKMDVKPGGIWKLTMHGPDGADYPNQIIFRRVVKPELLEYTHGSGDENDSNQFEVTVNFEERGKHTQLTMRAIFKTKEERDLVVDKYGALEGNKQTLNRLEEYLAKK